MDARAVAAKNIKAHALMTGTPVRQTGWVGVAGSVLKDDLFCPNDRSFYQLGDGQMFKR